jgi:hypothetical protein
MLQKPSRFKRLIIIIAVLFLPLALTVLAAIFPSFGDHVERYARLISYITPLIALLILLDAAREELASWRYKARAEAASSIIGKFRVFSRDLIYCVDTANLTPPTGEAAAECQIHVIIGRYIDSCSEISAQFPTPIRKKLDEHFEEMQKMAGTLSGEIYRQTHREGTSQRTPEDLPSIRCRLSKIQDFLDKELGPYTDKTDFSDTF